MPEAERRTIVRVELEAVSTRRTRITLTHEALPETDTYDGHEAGWAEIVRKLDEHLSQGGPTCR